MNKTASHIERVDFVNRWERRLNWCVFRIRPRYLQINFFTGRISSCNLMVELCRDDILILNLWDQLARGRKILRIMFFHCFKIPLILTYRIYNSQVAYLVDVVHYAS